MPQYNFYSNSAGVQQPSYGFNQTSPGASAYDFGQNSGASPDYSTIGNYSSPLGTGGNTATGGFGGAALANGGNAAGSVAGTLGLNVPTLQLGLGALGTVGNLWGAFQAQGLAKDQFDFNKALASKNLANSMQSYNTALTDKATARGVTEGQTDAQVNDYINKNKLS